MRDYEYSRSEKIIGIAKGAGDVGGCSIRSLCASSKINKKRVYKFIFWLYNSYNKSRSGKHCSLDLLTNYMR